MGRCKTCLFWVPTDTDGNGDCRRYPPTVIREKSVGVVQRWPHLHATKGCGEHRTNPDVA